MNELGSEKLPFVFLISFDMQSNLVESTRELSPSILLCKIGTVYSNATERQTPAALCNFSKEPPDRDRYGKAFEEVMHNLNHGNSYLLNLTLPSEISTDCSLSDLFHLSDSRYKILLPGKFLSFSPETFVRIDSGIISAYPMKGTIDADLPGALETILADSKELAEHYTIVDLLRNDLSMVAADVRVDRFRYAETIRTCEKDLIQISSAISGRLEPDYNSKIGDIIFRLLPAGSVTGAPKQKTVEIILSAENYDRGFYTGVFGYFDGRSLDSAVLIRYIEQEGEKLIFKSGGGITVNSNPESEYQELIDKVYVPIA